MRNFKILRLNVCIVRTVLGNLDVRSLRCGAFQSHVILFPLNISALCVPASLSRNRRCFALTTAPVSLIDAEPSYWLTNKRKQTARPSAIYGGINLFLRYIDMLSKPLRAGAAAVGLTPLVIPAPTCNRAEFPGLLCVAAE